MLSFIYDCLANKNEEFILVDQKVRITEDHNIKTVIETNRIADYYGVTALSELCARAIDQIVVNSQNVEWLHILLEAEAPGEEALKEKVGLIKQMVKELEDRRRGLIRTRLRSSKLHKFADKSLTWLDHEVKGHLCDVIVLHGSVQGVDKDELMGSYRRKGWHNGRPLYQMTGQESKNLPYIYYEYSDHHFITNRISDPNDLPYIFYAGDGDWAVGFLYEDEEGYDDFVIVKIPDKSVNVDPPVYTPSTMYRRDYETKEIPETGLSLSCGSPEICQKIKVTCEEPNFPRPALLGGVLAYRFLQTWVYAISEHRCIELATDPDNPNYTLIKTVQTIKMCISDRLKYW